MHKRIIILLQTFTIIWKTILNIYRFYFNKNENYIMKTIIIAIDKQNLSLNLISVYYCQFFLLILLIFLIILNLSIHICINLYINLLFFFQKLSMLLFYFSVLLLLFNFIKIKIILKYFLCRILILRIFKLIF